MVVVGLYCCCVWAVLLLCLGCVVVVSGLCCGCGRAVLWLW